MRPVRRIGLLLIILLLSAAACTPSAAPVPVSNEDTVGAAVNATLTANAFFSAATAATLPAVATVTPQPGEPEPISATATVAGPQTAEAPSSTPIPTRPAALALTAMVSVSVATNCRSGPARSHDWLGGLYPGQSAKVVGQYPDLNYWIIENPSGSGTCWLWGGYATVTGDTSSLPVWPAPTQPAMPRLTAKIKLACRTAPDDSYEKVGTLAAGESVEIAGRTIGSGWWLVQNPDAAGTCWAPGLNAAISGNLNALPVVSTPSGVPLPTATRTATVVPEGFDCKIVSTLPGSGTVFSAGANFNVIWKVKNTGKKTWKPASVDYRYLSGEKMHLQKLYDLPATVAPGDSIDISVDMKAPADDGHYSAAWGLMENGDTFCQMTVSIRVK